MSVNSLDEYWVPEHVKEYLRRLGFVLPLDDMEPWIRSWDDWMGARGDFYDYRDKDGGSSDSVVRYIRGSCYATGCRWGNLCGDHHIKVIDGAPLDTVRTDCNKRKGQPRIGWPGCFPKLFGRPDRNRWADEGKPDCELQSLMESRS